MKLSPSSSISMFLLFIRTSCKQSTFEIEFFHKYNSLMVLSPFNPSQTTYNPSFEIELSPKPKTSKFWLFINTPCKQSAFEI